MKIKNNKLIVVLGMHRSGTSAITRGLQVMGVELGDRLMPPFEDNNPKGFWEDIDLNELNIEMLNAIDSDWYHLAAIGSIDVEILRKEGYFLRAAELLRQKVGSAPIFGFKDPRVAKLLPFWKEVFSHCQFDVSYVMAMRHPLSVVKSLAKRDGIEAGQSYLLWLVHVITSLTSSAGDKRVFVDYDRLMQSPDYELNRIAKHLNLKIDLTELQNYKAEFLDQGLRHTVYELNDLLLDDTCPPIVCEVYASLLDVASKKTKVDEVELQSKLVRWLDEVERLRSSLLLVDKLMAQKLVATQAVAERDGQLTNLNQAITERDKQIANFNQAVTERDKQLANLNQALDERDGHIANFNHGIAERDAYIRELVSSKSWLITKPIRWVSRIVRGDFIIALEPIKKVLHSTNSADLSPHSTNSADLSPQAEAHSSALPADSNQMLLIDMLSQASHSEGRIAIHLHMYYHDLANEFSQYLKNMPFGYDLYVSVASEEGIEVCQKAFSGLAKQRLLIIEQVPNHGRDIAPMFCTFGSRLKDYDYVAHLHSKKSLFNKGATEGWRQYLCDNLLGSEERIRRIFGLMQGDAPRGIVYPQNYRLLPYAANTWLANKAAGTAWCARLGISPVPQGYFDFPAGSMFWARGNALKPLFDTGITLDDFAEEGGQNDGTFAHCLERLLVLSSLKQGYKPGIIKDLQHPTWSAWGFQQYVSRTFQWMLNQLADPAIKLIAFDIFDTLLCRPLMDAESVKAIVAERIGGKTGRLYMQYRPIAEGQAREAAGKDIGMTEIFARLGKLTGLSDETLASLRSLEEEVEMESVAPRPEVVELYRQALATGKPVVLMSDMFLPRAVIEKILQNNGITGWSMLFLSNEIGLRKDTGELYESVFAHYGISPAEMIMVGDNERSDLQIPCDKGVVGMHVLRPLEFARGLPRFHSLIDANERSGDLNRELTLGLVLKQNFSSLCFPELDPFSLVHPTPYNVGYSLIGPLLVGMSQWLVDSAHRDGVDRLYFLAREGQLIKRVYDLWTEGLDDLPQADYLILSRRAVSVPMIETLEDVLNIAKATYFPNTICNFLYERYGFQLSAERWTQITDQVQWSSNSTVEVYNQQIDHLLPLLNALEAEIIAEAALEYRALKHYLCDMGLEKPGRQAVVDIGYSGTIQGYLNRLVTTPVHGYYLITDQRSDKVAQKHNVNIRGCYLESIDEVSTTSMMYPHNFQLEKMLSSDDAQIVHYELDQENNLTAHYRELSNDEAECFSFRKELQEGIIRYALDAKSIRERIFPSYKPSREIAYQLCEAFFAQQSPLETDLLQKVVLDDHYCGRGIVR
ncbi:MAG: rhamnan synthesis F family protein [Methylococcaceae bacterium]|jgi:predicted HAD superfamily hydrolase